MTTITHLDTTHLDTTVQTIDQSIEPDTSIEEALAMFETGGLGFEFVCDGSCHGTAGCAIAPVGEPIAYAA